MSEKIYIYQADVYCETCIDRIKEDLPPPEFPHDERILDSDEYPKGPFIDEQHDLFQHCCICEEFLHNPLTVDGVIYTLNLIEEWSDLPESGRMEILDQWVEELRSYGLLKEQEKILDEYEEQVKIWKNSPASKVPLACTLRKNLPAPEGVEPPCNPLSL